MANRFPLIVDSSSQSLKELVASDNLDLASSGIVNVTSIGATNINVTGIVTVTSIGATNINVTGIVTATSVAINTTTTNNTKLYLNGNAASNIVGLGSTTATTTLDFSQGNNFSLTLGATITIANPTGVTTGQSGVIFIQENGTGAYTVGWGTSWDFASATAPTLITTANALNALPYFARSTTSIVVGSVISGIGTL